MDKPFNKNNFIFLLVEAVVLGCLILLPLVTLGIFLIDHNIIALSTKTWLLLSISYLSFLLILLPVVYSLAIELSGIPKTPSA